jgi:hypothetical protein
MFSNYIPIISAAIETAGIVWKPSIQVCNVNASINYPSPSKTSAEMLSVLVGIRGNLTAICMMIYQGW